LLSAKIGRLTSNKKMNFSMTRLYLAGLAFIFLSSCSNDNFMDEISGPTMGTSYSIKSSKRINQKEITEELERIDYGVLKDNNGLLKSINRSDYSLFFIMDVEVALKFHRCYFG